MVWHYLRGNKSESGPQKIVVVDTETRREIYGGRPNSSIERFRLGCATYYRLSHGRPVQRRWLAFKDVLHFWKWVQTYIRPRETLWIFAHNLGFDSRALDFWGQLDKGTFVRKIKRRRKAATKSGQRHSEWRHGLLVTGDPPTVIEAWTCNGGMVRLIDTMNFWPVSLAAVGRWVGRDKLPMPDPWEPDETWLAYCQRDTEILDLAIQKYISWVKESQLGMFAITLPSQAMHGYRHSGAGRKIVIHDEAEVKKMEGESYRGGEIVTNFIGRVGHDCKFVKQDLYSEQPNSLYTGTKHVHQLDSNSLYPAIMAGNLYPCRLVDWRVGGDEWRPPHSLDWSCSIVECLLDCSGDGVYTRRSGRSGRYTGLLVATLAGPELARHAREGAVVAVRRYARYELADLFSGWVERWWQLRWMYRLSCDIMYSDMCKKIMNSLYGKFAQHVYDWVDREDIAPPFRWGLWCDVDVRDGTVVQYRSIAGETQERQQRGYHANSFPAIAAFVTSYAREHMRTLRQIAGDKQVYYQGVDSLYTSDLGLERLRAAGCVDPAALGKLRLECSEGSADFVGHGLYRIGDRWCRTSLARGAIECTPGEWDQQNMERLESALGRSPEHGIVTTNQRRVIQAASPLGTIGTDGWVSPRQAVWGENPAETTDQRNIIHADLGHRTDETSPIIMR